MKEKNGEEPCQQLQEPLNPLKARSEDERLGGRPPLKTIVVLSIGPIMGGTAMITGMLNNFVWIIVGSFAMYYAYPTDGAKIVFGYVFAHGMAVPGTIIALFKPMLNVWRLAREEKEMPGESLELKDV